MRNLVVYHRLTDEQLRQIAAVSSEVKVQVGLPAARLQDGTGSRDFPPADIETLLPSADILFAFRLPEGTRAKARRLKWLALATAGTDQARAAGFFQSEVAITTSSGIHARPMGEYALAAMLMFAHQFPRAFRQQTGRVWKQWDSAELGGKTVGILGLGHIGLEVARLALGFDMKVVATRRGVTEPVSETVDGGRVEMLPSGQLHDLLGRSDFVVLAVPLVADTEHLIGPAELAAMKPAAFLINISRGKVVDEKALVQALASGRIAGACLDVFEQEPLPADSPLWGMENVILTPHLAGSHERYNERAVDLLCENLRRYVDGQPLLNLVNKERGY